jgi:5-enolpyruvylshikimate-3-phosphate synthase
MCVQAEALLVVGLCFFEQVVVGTELRRARVQAQEVDERPLVGSGEVNGGRDVTQTYSSHRLVMVLSHGQQGPS